MKKILRKMNYAIVPLMVLALVLAGFAYISPNEASAARSSALIVNHNSATLDGIPSEYIERAKSNYRMFYGHTSHGSQIMTGLDMIERENDFYRYHEWGNESGSMYITEDGGIDLGHNGDTGWADVTRDRLNEDSSINMVMWSWCAGVSDNTVEGINTYLNTMNQLEMDYPNVTFVYMTGHLWSGYTGTKANLEARNQQIRDYARNNNKVLYDFADIETYDPNGTAHTNDTDACQWCTEWCSTHSCPTCSSCAHSHCFNCYRKGQAFWWMMAKLAGWGGGSTDNGTNYDIGLANRLSGRILLQVEENGEAWYVYPGDKKKYYLGRPEDAFDIMRFLGLGITNDNLSKIPTYDNNIWTANRDIIDRVRGYILLQVELNGEAWYTSPVNERRYYMGRPADAFQLMRNLGLGITNSNLDKIETGEINR